MTIRGGGGGGWIADFPMASSLDTPVYKFLVCLSVYAFSLYIDHGMYIHWVLKGGMRIDRERVELNNSTLLLPLKLPQNIMYTSAQGANCSSDELHIVLRYPLSWNVL